MSYLTPEPLARFRETGRTSEAIVAGFLVGLVATYLHPAGLVLAGALLGVTAVSVREAFVLGVEFGVAVLVAWALLLVWHGVLGPVGTAVPLIYIALVSGVALPPLAAVAVRGLV
ncbi:hypothetical protein BRD20_06430 [Halobacteriales archaeon SW_8_65_20]|nr:MAG: hypothetical protein BRD20_06430 [Halobacteriales archaeon SW_8_65_20]